MKKANPIGEKLCDKLVDKRAKELSNKYQGWYAKYGRCGVAIETHSEKFAAPITAGNVPEEFREAITSYNPKTEMCILVLDTKSINEKGRAHDYDLYTYIYNNADIKDGGNGKDEVSCIGNLKTLTAEDPAKSSLITKKKLHNSVRDPNAPKKEKSEKSKKPKDPNAPKKVRTPKDPNAPKKEKSSKPKDITKKPKEKPKDDSSGKIRIMKIGGLSGDSEKPKKSKKEPSKAKDTPKEKPKEKSKKEKK